MKKRFILITLVVATASVFLTVSGDQYNSENSSGESTTVTNSGGRRTKHANNANVRGNGSTKNIDSNDRRVHGMRANGERRGQSQSDNNPPFPPRTDSFWLQSQRERGHRQKQGKVNRRLLPEDEEEITFAEDDLVVEDTVGNSGLKLPNIILIITDDQDIELGSMEYMPETLKAFREGGVEFRHGYVTTPMCCPSRSSLLTGLYVHNHEVYTNNDNCSSVLWREKHEKKTFAAYLRTSGYYTSYIGKYLNKYDGSHIPYGWDEWNALLMNSRFYNYTLNRNGRRFRYGNNYERDYYPDSIANDTADFLRRMSARAEAVPNSQPFFLAVSFPSPHGPEDSAPQYSQLFFNTTPHHTPSYNYAPNVDKQWILRVTPRMTPILKDFTNTLMTKRLQTLQSVDVAVKAMFDHLKTSGLSDNTYVFYTSDHGYHVGQFGLVKGKSMPYEFDIRVPFFLTGPKHMIQPGTKILEPVLNIDLAPTFLDLANIPVPSHMDGRSLLPLIRKYSPNYADNIDNFVWNDVFIIESSGRREPPSGSQGPRDLNVKKRRKLAKEQTKLSFVDNETVRMNNLCKLHPHPCQYGQKKYCRKEKGRIRFRKCRQNIDFVDTFDQLDAFGQLYQVNTSNGFLVGGKCRCRFKRSHPDWEEERRRIDDEIEILKQKIEELRQRRRSMRRKWTNNESQSHNQFRDNVTSTTASIWQPTEIPRTTLMEQFEDEDHVDEGEIDIDEDQDTGGLNNSEELDEDDEKGNNGGEETDVDDPEDLDDMEEQEPTDSSSTDDLKHNERIVVLEPVSVDSSSSNSEMNATTTTAATTTQEISNQSTVTLITVPEAIGHSDEDILPTSGTGDLSSFDVIIDNRETTGAPIENPSVVFVPGFGEDEREESSLVSFGFQSKDRGGLRHRSKGKGRYPMLTPDGLEKQSCDCSHDPRWIRKREREDRKRKKLMSKLRKKQRFLKRIRDPDERHQAETCGTEEKMNCFWHDNDHWRTAPFWTGGSFCFCMNSNNNTYSCLRSVNATHNYLYCQFITGFKMYFNLMEDPYQLKNVIGSLPAAHEDWMVTQLIRLKKCQGREECWSENANPPKATIEPTIWEQIFGRNRKKRKRGGRKRAQ